jgi:hypothetical protein
MTCLTKRLALAVLIVLTFIPATVVGKTRSKRKTAGAATQTVVTSPPAESNNASPQPSGSGSGVIQIAVTPLSAQVGAGSKQQFVASVTGASTPFVLWSVSGPGCLNLSCGFITGSGLYTAPPSSPSPPTVTVKATSFDDFTTSASASVTITAVAAPAVVVAPNPMQLTLGAQQQFTATVTGTANTQVIWSVVNNGCGFNCGYITATGLYTAPSTLPTSPLVTISASLNVFPPVTGSAQITIKPPVNSNGGLTISPGTVQLPARGLQPFSATINGSQVSFANWSMSGAGCTPATCGTITQSGFYSAPSVVSAPTTVTITANSVFPAGKSGSATIVLQPPVSVSVSPQNTMVNTSGQQQFTATVSNTSNTAVLWSVSCLGGSCGSINGNAVYTAPVVAPSPNTVTITAASLADLSQRASATLTVVGAGAAKVSISPSSNLQLSAGASLPFTASVVGPANTAVTWSVLGIGCIGSNCGAITQGGVYTAPTVLSGPAAVTITATSQANPAASASVSVQLVPLVGITLAASNPQMTSGNQQQFSAAVTGTSNPTVLWSVSGAACFVPNSCGIISPSGLYTAPAGVQSPLAVTVTATAQANPSKTASAGITVVPPVVVSVSPAGTKVSVASQQQYSAVVTGTSSTAVNWGVSGPGCTGSACGTITPNGLYTAPASIPVPATVNVVAALVSDSTKFGSAGLTVVPSNNSKLNGHYAFLFNGFDGTVAYQAAGTFIADGNGSLVSGIEDINCGPGAQDVICGSAPVIAMAFTGTYNLNADGRGTLTINSALPSATFTLAIAPTSGNARFVETDNNGIRGTGVLKLQVPSAFATNAFQGASFATGLVGVDSSASRIGVIGSMVFPTGMIQGATFQVNDGGQTFTLPVAGPNLTGTFSMSSNGRGLVALNAPGLGNSATVHFSMYVVSTNEMFLLSIDPVSVNPLLGGQLLQQQLPNNFPFAYFQPGTAVFSSSGSNGQNADVAIGRLTFGTAINGVGPTQFAVNENNGGSITSQKALTGNYILQGGQEVLVTTGLPFSGHQHFYLYPFGLNSGFLVGDDTTVLFGKVESQSITIPDHFAFGPDSLVVPDSPLISGTGSLVLPQMTGNEDLSQVSGFTPGLALSGTWPTSFSDGSGTISLTLPSQESLAFWVVSFSKIVAVQTDSTALSPTLLLFEQ